MKELSEFLRKGRCEEVEISEDAIDSLLLCIKERWRNMGNSIPTEDPYILITVHEDYEADVDFMGVKFPMRSGIGGLRHYVSYVKEKIGLPTICPIYIGYGENYRLVDDDFYKLIEEGFHFYRKGDKIYKFKYDEEE